MTTYQNTWRVKDHIYTLNYNTAFFNNGGDLNYSLSDLLYPCYFAAAAFDLYRGNRRKVLYELESITMFFKTTDPKKFKVIQGLDYNGTLLEIVKVYEDLAFTGLQLILMRGIDFNGIYHAFYNSGTDYFHLDLSITAIQCTLSDYFGQILTCWKEIQG